MPGGGACRRERRWWQPQPAPLTSHSVRRTRDSRSRGNLGDAGHSGCLPALHRACWRSGCPLTSETERKPDIDRRFVLDLQHRDCDQLNIEPLHDSCWDTGYCGSPRSRVATDSRTVCTLYDCLFPHKPVIEKSLSSQVAQLKLPGPDLLKRKHQCFWTFAPSLSNSSWRPTGRPGRSLSLSLSALWSGLFASKTGGQAPLRPWFVTVCQPQTQPTLAAWSVAQ